MRKLLSSVAICALLTSSALGDSLGQSYRTLQGGTVPGAAMLVPTGTNDANGNPVYGPPGTAGATNSVGFFTDRKTDTPTVQNSAYASGNCIGGFRSISFQGSGPINELDVIGVMSKGGWNVPITFYVFSANPTSSTCTDKSTFTLNNADAANLFVMPFALTPTAPTGATQTFAENPNLGRKPASGTQTIWYAMVSGGAATPASTTDLVVSAQATQAHQ